jgi:hypothetical protein
MGKSMVGNRRMTMTERALQIIESWPEESREAAQLVVDKYGEPTEATPSQLVWREVGPWKRMVATKEFYEHNFPAPHIDAVESFIDYRVPTEMFRPLAEYDGSVVVERTAGEVSARCHDEEANNLALNLMHDIVQGKKSVDEARDYYAKEFLDFRRGKATPYMEKLHFTPGNGANGDPDERVISESEIEEAKAEGSAKD